MLCRGAQAALTPELRFASMPQASIDAPPRSVQYARCRRRGLPFRHFGGIFFERAERLLRRCLLADSVIYFYAMTRARHA